jgi:hypothetical protein
MRLIRTCKQKNEAGQECAENAPLKKCAGALRFCPETKARRIVRRKKQLGATAQATFRKNLLTKSASLVAIERSNKKCPSFLSFLKPSSGADS